MNIYKEIQTSLDEAVLDADGFYDSTKFDYETLQDFLKQSFIKYLKNEVERLEKMQDTFYETDKGNGERYYFGNRTCRNCGLCKDSIRPLDQITHITNQIRGLEG